MQITKENKIRQTIRLVLDDDTKIKNKFLIVLKEFIEDETNVDIEGAIDRIDIEMYTQLSDIEIKLVTVKEDKLKLLSVK